MLSCNQLLSASLALVIAESAIAAPASASSYEIQQLPLLNTSGTGPDITQANDINNRGEVVGWAETGRLLIN